MAAACYLRRVRGRYVFRRRIPAGIRSRLRRSEVVKVLGPCTFTEAKRRALRLAVASEELFAAVAKQPLTPERVDAIARDLFDRALRLDDAQLVEFQPATEAERLDEVERVRRQHENYRRALRGNLWRIAAKAADRELAGRGLEAAAGNPVYHDLCRKLLRVGVEATRLQLAHLDGDYGLEPSDPLFKAGPVRAADPERPAGGGTAEAGPRLGELIAARLEAAKREWTGQTLHQNTATLRLFLEHVGDRPVGAVTRRDVSTFHEALAGLPGKWGQLPAFRGKTLKEMLALAGGTSGPRLSKRTLNRHASAISGLFTWARKHGRWAGESPAAGFVDERPSGGAGPRRRRWRPEELDRLFASPVWAGCKGPARRSTPGAVVLRDARYWAPLVGLYMGLRLEEIAKLRADDVRRDGEIWAVDVVGNEAGPVKEHTSNRTVPVHPLLVRLGFIDHLEAIRAHGGGPLWPELRRGGIDDKLGVGLSKWFGRYCREIGVKAPGLVFHSFRKNLATALHGLGVAEAVVSDLLGHEHKTLSFRLYSEGPQLRTFYPDPRVRSLLWDFGEVGHGVGGALGCTRGVQRGGGADDPDAVAVRVGRAG